MATNAPCSCCGAGWKTTCGCPDRRWCVQCFKCAEHCPCNYIATVRECAALGCPEVISPHLLMCAVHWQLVPAHLKQAVYAASHPGTAFNGYATGAYIKAAQAARNFIKRREA